MQQLAPSAAKSLRTVEEEMVSDRLAKPVAWVDGWPVNVANLEDAVSAAIEATELRTPTAVFTLNLDHVVKLRQNSNFRRAYQSASIVTADGAPVVWLGRSQASSLRRTTGADLVLPLVKAAAAKDLPIALFGTSRPIIDAVTAKLAELGGASLRIAYADSPIMGFDPQGADADALLNDIVASGSRIVFVALGAPKQELFAARAVERRLPLTFVCVGAGLDFIANAQVRAPHLLQSSGLEWVWRLANDPRRLLMRYVACAGVLADIAVVKPTMRRLVGNKGKSERPPSVRQWH